MVFAGLKNNVERSDIIEYLDMHSGRSEHRFQNFWCSNYFYFGVNLVVVGSILLFVLMKKNREV